MPGCPKCGNVDIQVLELLTAWNEIERLEALLKEKDKPVPAPVGFTVPATANVDLAKLVVTPAEIVPAPLTEEEQTWKDRYEKMKSAYVQTRLEVSGSFGNWDFQTRKRVLEHEISSELGFII